MLTSDFKELSYNKTYTDFLNSEMSCYATRKGWQKSKKYIYMEEADVFHPETDEAALIEVCLLRNEIGCIVQWTPSLEDRSANDWALIPDV